VDTFTIVVYLISNFVVMLAIERMMGVFFEKRRTPFFVMACSYLLYFVLSSIGFLLWNIPIVSILITVSTCFIITLNYNSSTKMRFAATLGSLIIIFLADAIAFFIMGNYQVNPFYTIGVDNIYGFILMGALSYIFALLFRNFKNIRKSTMESTAFLVFYSLISVSTIVMLYVIIIYLPQVAAIVITIVTVGINIFIFYLHDTLSAAFEEKLKSALHTQEKEYYYAQCQLMQESAERVKTIRHDMKFHLATARDFTANNKASEATDYLGSLLDDINTGEVYSNTGNIAFDSIINYKLKTAAEDNIKVEIDVLIPKNLNMDTVDVVTILGNLLENALEAVAKVNDKIIKLNIEASKGNLFIKIDNTFDGEVRYAKGKDGAEKVIATRKDGDNHGYGLKNIRRTVEKYSGHLDITHDDGVFYVGVLLFVGE